MSQSEELRFLSLMHRTRFPREAIESYSVMSTDTRRQIEVAAAAEVLQLHRSEIAEALPRTIGSSIGLSRAKEVRDIAQCFSLLFSYLGAQVPA